MPETTARLVRLEADRLGVPLSEPHASAAARLFDLIARWGRSINLTGADDLAVLVSRHLADGLLLSRELTTTPARCVDVGSGAGLPGLLVAILRPDLQLTLVEPRQRRCAFLRTAAHTLSLSVQICACRIEDARLPPHDVAWSRATWSPAAWLERAASLVHPGGAVVAFLGREPAPPPPHRFSGPREVRYQLLDGAARALAFYVLQTSECFT